MFTSVKDVMAVLEKLHPNTRIQICAEGVYWDVVDIFTDRDDKLVLISTD